MKDVNTYFIFLPSDWKKLQHLLSSCKNVVKRCPCYACSEKKQIPFQLQTIQKTGIMKHFQKSKRSKKNKPWNDLQKRCLLWSCLMQTQNLKWEAKHTKAPTLMHPELWPRQRVIHITCSQPPNIQQFCFETEEDMRLEQSMKIFILNNKLIQVVKKQTMNEQKKQKN